MNINLANIDFCPGGKSATLTETTAEILLTETQKIIVPPEGTDGFNKVTITHAPVEESVSATITENGTHTITPSEGFGAMFGVSVDVNVPSVTDDKIQYFNRKPTADDAGLKEIGWTDDDVNYFKYNNYVYPWEADNYKVSDANKQIVINSASDISSYKNNPDFQYCPKFDTSVKTSMSDMFSGCKALTSIPQLDTSKVTNMGNMFYECPSLTSVPQLDTSKVTDMGGMFRNCSSLTTLSGFTGLKVDLNLSDSPNLAHDSLLNGINKATDVTSSPKTLTLGTTNLTKLTDKEKAVATNKGWILQ